MTYMGTDRRTGIDRRLAAMTEAEVMVAHDASNAGAAVRLDTHGNVRGLRAEQGSLVRLAAPAMLIGAGLAGIMDSAVFHHLLRWHHAISGPFTPGQTELVTGPQELRGDGIQELVSGALIVIGLILLWTAASRRPHTLWKHAAPSFVGWVLVGWSLANVLVVSLPQLVLDRHHVNVVGGGQLGWDLIFVGISLTLGAIGLGLAMQGRPRDTLHDDWMG